MSEPSTAMATEMRLPPAFTPVRLREHGDAFAHALAVAAVEGAGTLVYVGRFDLAEFALVLEPDEPLERARLAFYAGMTALTDALAAHAQPETAVAVDWPGAITVNLGLVGGGRLAWPAGVGEDEAPPWLVFGGMIRTATAEASEPGLNPAITVLDEEGFGGLETTEVIVSFAKNFMVALDAWQAEGFAAVAKTYLERLPREPGVSRAIAENGDLLVKRGPAPVERVALLPALVAAEWYDPQARAPRR